MTQPWRWAGPLTQRATPSGFVRHISVRQSTWASRTNSPNQNCHGDGGHREPVNLEKGLWSNRRRALMVIMMMSINARRNTCKMIGCCPRTSLLLMTSLTHATTSTCSARFLPTDWPWFNRVPWSILESDSVPVVSGWCIFVKLKRGMPHPGRPLAATTGFWLPAAEAKPAGQHVSLS